MIIGIGNDLVDIRRIAKALAKHGTRFEERSFTPHERYKAARHKGTPRYAEIYAKRFAAKEACSKALGTGFSGAVYMRDIGVTEDEAGRPFLTLTGGALERLHDLIPAGMSPVLHLSLSDEPPFAQAFVIIEARPANSA